MRYVSEQFQAIQDELLRPQLNIRFEIGSNVTLSTLAEETTAFDFDETVAPYIEPADCTNEYFYAVVGDGVGVDNPNRICAPDNSGDFSTPEHTVPCGVTSLTSANAEALIGSNDFFGNIVEPLYPITLRFGGLIPEEVRVEGYDYNTETWSTITTIVNTDMSNEIVYTPQASEDISNIRFYVKNSQTDGRFQLLWIMSNENQTIVFENDLVSSAKVDTEIDLTSQTLPQYSMTVECLDVEEIYTPESSYWNNQFKDGALCFLKAGYEIGDSVEYVPVMYGVLTKKPTYSEGKITFNVETKLNDTWGIVITSIPSNSVSAGDLVASRTFKEILEDNEGNLFDSYDGIFADATDEDNSLCNYYGELDGDEARQLVANALGGYITAGIGSVALHSVTAVQYKTHDIGVDRNEQVQCTLESQPKVGKIEITRYDYTLLSEYKDVQSASTRMEQGENVVEFKVPFYPIGRITAMNFPSGYSIAGFDTQYANDEGGSTVNILINKSTSGSATRTFTVRFYKVTSTDNKEVEIISNIGDGEAYTNDNKLITCSHVSKKVNNVAHMVNDVPDKYEVEYIQDLRFELGDVIRLETQEGVFKSCIITGLEYSLPGSAGRLTCRKIFSLLDCPQAVFEPDGLTIKYKNIFEPDWFTSTILETSENGVVVGLMKYNETESVFFVLGATKMTREYNGTEAPEYITNFLTDLNGHKWGFLYYFINSDYFDTNAPILELPDYDAGAGAESAAAFGIINFLSEIYSAQGMTAPVDYTCTVEQIA